MYNFMSATNVQQCWQKIIYLVLRYVAYFLHFIAHVSIVKTNKLHAALKYSNFEITNKIHVNVLLVETCDVLFLENSLRLMKVRNCDFL